MPQQLKKSDFVGRIQYGVVLTDAEFAEFLAVLEKHAENSQIVKVIREMGHFAPVDREPGTEWVFRLYGVPKVIDVLAVCRATSLEAMKRFVRMSP